MVKKTKLVFGVGINDADYSVVVKVELPRSAEGKRQRQTVWACPFYSRWTHLLGRSYSPAFHKIHPSYIGCHVIPEWHYFMNFRGWMEKQDWEGKHIDKDILFPGNKLYSPETCVFVSQEVNKFILDRENDRGEWPIGVYYDKKSNKFVSQITHKGLRKLLGCYNSPEEAHAAWLLEKLSQAKILASQQTDERVAKALVARYENYTSMR